MWHRWVVKWVGYWMLVWAVCARAEGAADFGPLTYYLEAWYKLESHAFGRYMFNHVAGDLKYKKDVVLNLNFDTVDRLLKNLEEANGTSALPTVLFVPAYLLPGLVKKYPVAEIPSELMPNMDAQALAAVTVNEKFYALPFHLGEHLLLYYNKQYVKEAPAAWKDVLALQEGLTKQNVETIIWPYNRFRWFMPYWGAFGGWLPAKSDQALDVKPLIDSLDYYKALRLKGPVSTVCERFCQKDNCNERCEAMRFASRKVALLISGDWNLREVENPLGNDLGVAPLPNVDGSRAMVNVMSPVVAVFFNNPFEGAQGHVAKTVLEYLSSEKVQDSLFTDGSRIPALKSSRDKMFSSKSLTPVQQIVVQEYQKARQLPAILDTSVLAQSIEDLLRVYLAGSGLSAQDAAAMLITQLNAQRKEQPAQLGK
jgi:maltose-binding protein MalE